MPSLLPGPAYRIHTERLVIRCWEPRDARALKDAIDTSLEHLRPWMPWAKYEPEELQDKIQRLRKFRAQFDDDSNYIYGILNDHETEVIGGTGLHPRVGANALEIGYWIHKRHINNGYATEAAAAMTKAGFELHGLDRIEIRCDPTNLASAAVPRKLGFTHEATLPRRITEGYEEPRDVMIWALYASQYPGSPAASIKGHAYDVLGRKIF